MHNSSNYATGGATVITQKALVTPILTLMEEDEAEVRSAAQNVIKGSADNAADRC